MDIMRCLRYPCPMPCHAMQRLGASESNRARAVGAGVRFRPPAPRGGGEKRGWDGMGWDDGMMGEGTHSLAPASVPLLDRRMFAWCLVLGAWCLVP